MKTSFTVILATLVLAIQVQAYPDIDDGALNVRHMHMVRRDEDGDIVSRSFVSTYDLAERSETGPLVKRCKSVTACGTPAGCTFMAPIRFCKGDSPMKSLSDAAKQTGANGRAGLRMMADGLARGPVGMIANTAASTAKTIKDAEKKSKAEKKKNQENNKKKREVLEEGDILNRRDHEFVVRDEDYDLVERGDYTTYDLAVRDETGSIATRECSIFNGVDSCL